MIRPVYFLGGEGSVTAGVWYNQCGLSGNLYDCAQSQAINQVDSTLIAAVIK